MLPKMVIFDMDGVLVDSYEAWYAAYDTALASLGMKLTKREFDRRFWGVPWQVTCKEDGFSVSDCIRSGILLLEKYIEFSDKVKIIDGAKSIVKSLKSKGVKTCLLTNTPKWVAETVMKKWGFEFDIIPDTSVIKPKPDPEGVQIALDEFGLGRNDVVFIGDTTTDEETGKSAGIKTLIVGKDIIGVSELPDKLGLN